jgi:hypothetical protein
MLIKFFRSSFIIQYLAIVLISAGLWIPGFLNLQEIRGGISLTTPLYNLAHPLVVLLQPYNPIIAYIIVLISGLTLNNILVYHELTPKNNLLPAFIFILLFSSNPVALNLYPLVITIPLFTWFIHTIYRVNDEPENNLAVFNASLILSVISMIYFPAILLFLLLWLMLLVFGTFSGRNIIITFIGFLLPYVYLVFYYFWIDKLDEAGTAYADFFENILRFQAGSDYLQYGIWAFFLILILSPAFFKITGTLTTYGISFRKKMGATNWFLIISAPLILLSGDVNFSLLILLPSSILIAHYYNIFKRSVWNEVMLLVFLAMAAAHNYLYL